MVLLLCGCTTLYNPATERNEHIFINSQTESSIGKSVQQEILRDKKLSRDAFMQERVQRIGARLTAVSDRKDVSYNFYVLEDKELNAMALPGGLIYVNSGLVRVLDDDQLAYVVGHEIGHVAARHIVKKMQSSMTYQVVSQIAFIWMGNNRPLTQNVSQGVDTVYGLISLGYSRKDEYEADRLGVKYALYAGFDPYAALSALEKIKSEEGASWKILGYFRSHPYADERIASLKEYIPILYRKKGK